LLKKHGAKFIAFRAILFVVIAFACVLFIARFLWQSVLWMFMVYAAIFLSAWLVYLLKSMALAMEPMGHVAGSSLRRDWFCVIIMSLSIWHPHRPNVQQYLNARFLVLRHKREHWLVYYNWQEKFV